MAKGEADSLIRSVFDIVKEKLGSTSDRICDKPMSYPVTSLIDLLGFPIIRSELGDNTEVIDAEFFEELNAIKDAFLQLGYDSEGYYPEGIPKGIMLELNVIGVWNLIANPIRFRGDKVYLIELPKNYCSIDKVKPTVSEVSLKGFSQSIVSKLLSNYEEIQKLRRKANNYFVATVIFGIISAIAIISIIIRLTSA